MRIAGWTWTIQKIAFRLHGFRLREGPRYHTFFLNLEKGNDPEDPSNVSAIAGSVLLYRNMLKQTGELQFEDATKNVFAKLDNGYWMGFSMADVNADGRIDFFVSNIGNFPDGGSAPHLLLLSQPDVKYINASISSGIGLHGFNWGSAFIDADDDGDSGLVTVCSLYTSRAPLTNPGLLFLNYGRDNITQVEELGLEYFQTGGLAVAHVNEDINQDVLVVGQVPVSRKRTRKSRTRDVWPYSKGQPREIITSVSVWRASKATRKLSDHT